MAKQKPDAVEPEEHPRAFFRAKLDADRLYWGVEAVAALEPGDVEVPERCDLKPGHYRWNPEAKPVPRFEVLERSQRRVEQGAPLADRALYELIWQMHQEGSAIPQYCADWACWYETTMDASAGQLFKRRLGRALGRVKEGE